MARLILGILSTLIGLLGLVLVVNDLAHIAQYGVIDGNSLGLLAHAETVFAHMDGREPSVLVVFGMWFFMPAAFLIVGIWMMAERSPRREGRG